MVGTGVVHAAKLSTKGIFFPFIFYIKNFTNEEGQGDVTLHIVSQDVKSEFQIWLTTFFSV